MTAQEAIDLIGEKIYVYEVYETSAVDKKDFTYAVYESKIIMIGKDFAYDDDNKLTEIGRTHYFNEYNEKWFTDKELCEKTAKKEIEERLYDEQGMA